MGCWNATDFITNTPIWDGEEVVGIVLKTTQMVPDYLNEDGWHQLIEAIHFGTYDGYGWFEEIPHDEEKRPDLRTIFTRKANWDEIVQKFPISNENYHLSCEVWRTLLDVDPSREQNPVYEAKAWRDGPSTEILRDLMKVTLFAYHNRLSLEAGLVGMGHQSWRNELPAQEARLEMIKRDLERFRSRVHKK